MCCACCAPTFCFHSCAVLLFLGGFPPPYKTLSCREKVTLSGGRSMAMWWPPVVPVIECKCSYWPRRNSCTSLAVVECMCARGKKRQPGSTSSGKEKAKAHTSEKALMMVGEKKSVERKGQKPIRYEIGRGFPHPDWYLNKSPFRGDPDFDLIPDSETNVDLNHVTEREKEKVCMCVCMCVW